MKKTSVSLVILLIALCVGLHAQENVSTAEADSDASQIEKFTSDELHALVAPIALYPDALLAQILPASTFPIQIVEAYRYTQTAATPDTPPANSTWDSSVIALLHYPPILKKLNNDLTWTEQFGVAVTYQMADVTMAIQQVRAEAEAAGNLKSNDKQQIVVEKDIIQIVPADPQFIYVPTYDPVLVCEPYVYGPPLFSWGIGFGFGIWLGYDFDWWHQRIWMHHHWYGGGWHPYSHTGFWQPPHRRIPSWYMKNGGTRPGLPGAFRGIVPPKLDRVRPKAGPLPNATKPSVISRPSIEAPPKYSVEGEGLGNSRNQTNKESWRGRNSRDGDIKSPVIPKFTPAPTVTPPRQSYHEEFGHYDYGSTTQRESNRGAISRGSGSSSGSRRR